MMAHQSGPEPGTIILMDDGTGAAPAPDHNSQCCNSANLMCDTDRFFQAGDALETSGSRDDDHLAAPKSP